MNGVLVKASPLLKGLLCVLVVFLVVPVQHAGRIFNTNTLAELLEDAGRVVQEIVSVNNADLDGVTLLLAIGSIGLLLASDFGPNLSTRAEVIE